MEVHSELGGGFSEIVYKDALELEFADRSIFFKREKQYSVSYKGTVLQHCFFADFIVFDQVVLEVKAVAAFTDAHIAQTLNYLKVSKCKIALLVNFSKGRPEYQRLIL